MAVRMTTVRDKLPRHVVKDDVKWVIMPAKIILQGLSMWPEEQNKKTAFLKFLLSGSFLFFLLGQITFIKRNISNLAEIVACATSIVMVVQTTIKQLLLIYYKEAILRMLSTIYYEFWPSSIAGKDLQQQLSKASWYLVAYCLAYTFIGVSCAFQYFFVPLIAGNATLPFLTYYEFVKPGTMLYAAFYVWQSFMSPILPLIFGGFDLLFASLTWNCIAQFIILQNFFRCAYKGYKNAEKDKALLIRCIVHHDRIIRICKEIEDTFSLFLLVLYLSNVVALCVGSFILMILPMEFGKMLSYLLAFLGELLICCFIASELTFQSGELSKAVFESEWYLPNVSTDIKKSLMMIMVKSQQEVRLTMGGFGAISLMTFVQVLRLSFSLFTLLRSMLQRKR